MSIKGTLETEPGKTVFRPDIPQGVTVSFDGASGSISYDGIVFGNSVIGFSRLMPLHTALADGSAKSVFGKASHPDTVTGEGFCLTVHKEITE